MSIFNVERIGRLNFFYRGVFGQDIEMDSFDSRLKLQKSIYILKCVGIKFSYSFTWYIYGPYSSDLTHDGYFFVKKKNINSGLYSARPEEQNIITSIKRGQIMLNDSDNAEVIASFLYLKEKYGSDYMAEEQLKIRKPRFSSNKIQQVMQEWIQLTNPIWRTNSSDM